MTPPPTFPKIHPIWWPDPSLRNSRLKIKSQMISNLFKMRKDNTGRKKDVIPARKDFSWHYKFTTFSLTWDWSQAQLKEAEEYSRHK